jgi:hypothetical protein
MNFYLCYHIKHEGDVIDTFATQADAEAAAVERLEYDMGDLSDLRIIAGMVVKTY